jgi:pyruvate dehydrogenase E1 component alpha subunit
MPSGGFTADRDDWPVQILDEDGYVRDDATVPSLEDAELLDIYEEMRFARVLDERATTLHRQGRMGTYPPLQGQEAAQVASTHALDDADWLSFQYREHGAVVARGLSHEYLLYWLGHEIGNEWLADKRVFPINISIASHLPHATGMAWAAALQGDRIAVACHFGDGATSEGDFHEALNFAGVFDAPAIFFCNNNQYAISVPRDRQTASPTIAQKADAYGFPGVQVDGMDPLAVYAVTKAAAERAKAEDPDGPRPSLIEAEMYRLGAHTTVDDPSAYREDSEVEEWRQRDPIPRMETFCRERGLLDDETVAAIGQRARDEIDALVEAAEAHEATPEDMFEHTYETATPRVREGRERLRRLRERHGDTELQQDE